MEFRSDKLWETYIAWLKERGNIKKIMEILDLVLKLPTQQYRHHYEMLDQFYWPLFDIALLLSVRNVRSLFHWQLFDIALLLSL